MLDLCWFALHSK